MLEWPLIQGHVMGTCAAGVETHGDTKHSFSWTPTWMWAGPSYRTSSSDVSFGDDSGNKAGGGVLLLHPSGSGPPEADGQISPPLGTKVFLFLVPFQGSWHGRLSPSVISTAWA